MSSALPDGVRSIEQILGDARRRLRRLLPQASYHLRAVVMCSEGYTSSLAAAALQDLGLFRATDLEGGFKAWQESGLPTTSG